MANSKRDGFSLVELTIVVVVLGVLATFAVPRFLRAVERSKAAEAINYLDSVHTAQEQHLARSGRYANLASQLDVAQKAPKYFTVSRFSSSNFQTNWRMTLRRRGAASGYGRYTVVYEKNGFNRALSTIPDALLPNK
jgi:prepilin-type N-terminal cleavage/methylation domain-containing protein